MPKPLTGKQIERLRTKMLAEPCLSPLHGDSTETRATIEEIYTFIRALGPDATVEYYKDKLGAWRRQLRTCRYDDWRKTQGIEARQEARVREADAL